MIEEINLFVWLWLLIGIAGTMFIRFLDGIQVLFGKPPMGKLKLFLHILLGPFTIVAVSRKVNEHEPK